MLSSGVTASARISILSMPSSLTPKAASSQPLICNYLSTLSLTTVAGSLFC